MSVDLITSDKMAGNGDKLAPNLIRNFEADSRYKQVRDAALSIMRDIKLPYHGGVKHPLEFEKYALAIAAREAERSQGMQQQDNLATYLPLISLAAVLHETGMSIGHKDHEFESAKIAQKLMGNAGYDATETALVGDLIFYGTRCFPQAPRNRLEQIMADADLANLGTDEFFRNGELLRKEQRVENKLEWVNKQIEFVGNHAFFTNAARELFDEQQKKNLGWLQSERNVLLGIA